MPLPCRALPCTALALIGGFQGLKFKQILVGALRVSHNLLLGQSESDFLFNKIS